LEFENTVQSACFLGVTAVTLFPIYSGYFSAELEETLAGEIVGEKS
jgi:hypothetical protein